MSIQSEDFTADKIGKGIWHSWHLTSAKAKVKRDIEVIYEFILIYVSSMICEICSEHAHKFVSENNFTQVLYNKDLTDTEIINEFNHWLYNFHKEANKHAGKQSPLYDDIISFYLNVQRCHDNCGN